MTGMFRSPSTRLRLVTNYIHCAKLDLLQLKGLQNGAFKIQERSNYYYFFFFFFFFKLKVTFTRPFQLKSSPLYNVTFSAGKVL